jgi:tagaturonate reductase
MEALSRRRESAPQRLPIRVVQFGEGNFLRAFADWMIDVMNERLGCRYGVAVVQPIERGMAAALQKQDGLYTTLLAGVRDGRPYEDRRLVGCVSQALNPYEDYAGFLALAENPDLRLCLSNTTEAGIAFDERDRVEDGPRVSFPGKVTLFLHRRYSALGGRPGSGLVFLPCELIDRNGATLREKVLRYIEAWRLDDGFRAWVERDNIFCNTLVDRIVAGYPAHRAGQLAAELGYTDDMLVLGEDFHIWVIEGPAAAREVFPADKAGLNVRFESMAPYRDRKVRILNGVQTALTPVGLLCGLRTSRDAVTHPVVGEFVRRLIEREIVPVVPPSKEDLHAYAEEVIERQKNPAIDHRLAAISLNSMSKWRTRVLPTVEDFLAWKGRLPQAAVFSLAALMALYRGESDGQKIELADDAPVLELYRDAWAAIGEGRLDARGLVERVLAFERLWGKDMNAVPGLADLAARWLTEIRGKGMERAAAAVNEVAG